MRRLDLDDLAIGKDQLQLPLGEIPFVRTVEVVERQRAAAQQELAQRRRFLVAQHADCSARRCRATDAARVSRRRA